VRNLFFAEVVSEPRHTVFQSDGVQSSVARRASTVVPRGRLQNIPESFDSAAFSEKFGSWGSAWRPLNDAEGDCSNSCFRCFQLIQQVEGDTSQFLDDARGFRAFKRQGRIRARVVGEDYVIHDDVFVEAGDQTLAYHRKRNTEKLVGLDVSLDLGLNVSL